MVSKLLALLGQYQVQRGEEQVQRRSDSYGKKFTEKTLQVLNFLDIIPSTMDRNDELNTSIEKIFRNYKRRFDRIEGRFRREEYQIRVGDELPSGILKLAKVYVAKKRKLKGRGQNGRSPR
jgi:DNA-directed RNA polymerase subunit beta